MVYVVNDTLWSCCEGHNTTFNDGCITVTDLRGTVLMCKPLTSEMLSELESGSCPICDSL